MGVAAPLETRIFFEFSFFQTAMDIKSDLQKHKHQLFIFREIYGKIWGVGHFCPPRVK